MPDSIAGLSPRAVPDATKIGNYCTEYFHEIYSGDPYYCEVHVRVKHRRGEFRDSKTTGAHRH